MNTTPSPRSGNEKSPKEIPERIPPTEHEPNIADGGEFLDDALRMREQPFGETATKKQSGEDKSKRD